jgi:hypothetical protein
MAPCGQMHHRIRLMRREHLPHRGGVADIGPDLGLLGLQVFEVVEVDPLDVNGARNADTDVEL